MTATSVTTADAAVGNVVAVVDGDWQMTVVTTCITTEVAIAAAVDDAASGERKMTIGAIFVTTDVIAAVDDEVAVADVDRKTTVGAITAVCTIFVHCEIKR